jgi:hypothetical protein
LLTDKKIVKCDDGAKYKIAAVENRAATKNAFFCIFYLTVDEDEEQ